MSAGPEKATKAEIRLEAWAALRAAGAARFPGARGRIPNFTGAEAAAAILMSTAELDRARVVKCNPDSPQRPVRHLALKAGKVVYMAVPRLRLEEPFLELDPSRLGPEGLYEASSIKGAEKRGRLVTIEEMHAVDVIVTGCVATSRRGERLGKGGGFSDLEYALLRAYGKIDAATKVVTTVHPAQLVEGGRIPVEQHDLSLDLVVTPDEVIETRGRPPRAGEILWDALSDEKIAEVPLLARLHALRGRHPPDRALPRRG